MSEKRNRKVGNIIIILTLLGFALIITRLSILYVREGVIDPFYRDPEVKTEYYRGSIYDRSGNILAMDSVAYIIDIDRRSLSGFSRVASLIEPYTNLTALEIEMIIDRSKSDDISIKSVMGRDKALEFEEMLAREYLSAHISVRRETERVYPLQNQGYWIIGRSEKGKGLHGAEMIYDERLRPPMRLGETIVKGEDITLSLDSDIEYLTHINTLSARNSDEDALSVILRRSTAEILGFTKNGNITEEEIDTIFTRLFGKDVVSLEPKSEEVELLMKRDRGIVVDSLNAEIKILGDYVMITASPAKEKASYMMNELIKMAESRGLISPRV